MDLRKLKKLIDLVEASGIAELEITEGEEKVRISRSGSAPAQAVVTPMPLRPQRRRPAPPARLRPPTASRRHGRIRGPRAQIADGRHVLPRADARC